MNIRKTITSEIEWNTIKKAQGRRRRTESCRSCCRWEMSWTSR